MLRLSLVVLLLAGSLAAQQTSEPGVNQSGVVRALGRVIPGATITAIQGEHKVVTTTDESGQYELDGLTHGDWTIQAEMVAFAPVKKTRTMEDLPPPALDFDLELQPLIVSKAEPAAAPAPASAAPPAATAETKAAEKPATAPAAAPATQTAKSTPPQRGRGQGQAGQRGDGFRSLNVNQTADGDMLAQMGGGMDGAAAGNADGASDALAMSGTLTSGLQTSQQGDPFGGGPRSDFGRGFGSDPSMGPGMGGDMGGGPGGGPPGGGYSGRGGGGPGGGPGGYSGRGGFGGGPPGGFSGRPHGDHGDRGPDGRRGPSSFGNRSSRGRQSLRGSAYYSLDNSALDARPFSLTGQSVERPAYAANRFGVSLFGPFMIPKLVKSDPKTFLFLSYSGTRSRSPYSGTATLPTLEERMGNFSDTSVRGQAVQIFDPTTHLPIPGNIIPQGLLSPQALGLLKYIPLPNTASGVQNYQFLTSPGSNSDNLSTRMNRTINTKNRLDGSFYIQNRNSSAAQLFGFFDPGSGRGINTSVNWTHNFTSHTINSLRFSFSRNRTQVTPFFAFGPDVASELGILGVSNSPINYGPPNLSFTNYGGLTDASPNLVRNQTAGVTEGVSFIHGTHNLSAGGEFRRMQLNNTTDADARGSFSFSGVATSAYTASGQVVPNTGYDFADFLLGRAQSATVRYGDTATYFRSSVYDGYIVDDWRVKTNLTINLSLRYEYFTPYSEKYNHIANLIIPAYFTGTAQVVTPGQAGFPAGLVNADPKAFSPRAGIAWHPFPKHSTLVRAGYGMFFNGSVYNQFPSRLAAQPESFPSVETANLVTSLTNPLMIQNAFLNTPTLQSSGKFTNTYAVDPNYSLGYVQNWQIFVQQTLPHNMTLEAGYLGVKGTHLDTQMSPNTIVSASPLVGQQFSISNAGLFTYETSDANSIYHAGQLRFTRRFAKGISGFVTYTHSKSIDNASTIGGGGATVAQNFMNLSAERGLSSFDQRNTLSSTFILTSPVSESGLLRGSVWGQRLLKDWTLSGGLTASSGTPYTARILGNQANAGGAGTVGSGRAEATGLPIENGVGFFNLLAFTNPLAGTLGDAARNTIPGMARYSLNLSLGRSFRIDDKRRIEFRLDTQNALNTVNYTGLSTVVNASNYGLATATANMRTVTATVRLRF